MGQGCPKRTAKQSPVGAFTSPKTAFFSMIRTATQNIMDILTCPTMAACLSKCNR